MSQARRADSSNLGGRRNWELSDAELEAPRIPRAPSTPDLVPGRDFHPLPSDGSWPREPEPSERARRGAFALGRGAFPALLATGVGFGLGVAVAWAIGVI
jgi:hypothetical protein